MDAAREAELWARYLGGQWTPENGFQPFTVGSDSGLDINSRYPDVPAMLGGDLTVKATLTPRRRSKRPKHSVEALEFIGACRRFLRAAGKRVAQSDEYELRALIALRADLDEAIATAVAGQRSVGRSWAYIALATDTTRQAAYERWGVTK